jgi:hypothetical protein
MVSANAWPFDDPPNCAVFVTREVMEREEPILVATHEDGEESWSFLGTTDGTLENCRIIALHEAAHLDPSLFTLADLPIGWRACRSSPEDAWTREPISDATQTI